METDEISRKKIPKMQRTQEIKNILPKIIYDKIVKEMDKHLECIRISVGTKKKFKHNKPYWTNELTDVWKLMKSAEKRFLKCKGPRKLKTYCRKLFIDARNDFDKLLRKTERNYRRQVIETIDEICTTNPREFWACLKKLGPRKHSSIPMKVEQNDIVVTDENVVLAKWENDFKSLYNGNSNDNQNFDNAFLDEAVRLVQDRESDMQNDTYIDNPQLNMDITRGEMVYMANKLKNNKSCGVDGIPNEILKNDTVLKVMCEFMNMCFRYSLTPRLWAKSVIKPIPKSATMDPCVPLNYRGISLLSCTSKLLSGVMNNRISKYCDSLGLILDEQNGFRKNRSCEEHLFTLTSILRNRISKKLSTYVAFIDLEKAFDRIDRTLLLYRLLCYNIDCKIYHLIKRMYTNTEFCLKINNLFTDWFHVSGGVRQGDNLSPTLFGLYINDLALHIKELNKGIKVGPDRISILLYADDMVLLAENERDLQEMLNSMSVWMSKWRLNVNVTKSKIMHFRRKRQGRSNFNFSYSNACNIEIVDKYKYLGIYLDEHVEYNECSRVLAESAGRALGGIISKFRSLKDCGYKTYTKLFDTGVIPILNYGSEIWGFGTHSKCDTILNKAMRYFLGVHRYAPTAGVQGDMAWMSLKYKRYIKILTFWNRLIKLDNNRLTKRVLLWFLNDSNNWAEDVRKISELLGMGENVGN